MQFAKYLPLLNPLLAAAFPVLFLYAGNTGEASPWTALSALWVILVGTAIMTGILMLIFRDSAKVGFIAVVWLLLFFSYGNIVDLIDGKTIGSFDIGRQRYLLAVEFIIGVSVLWLAFRAKTIWSQASPYIAAGLGVMVLINVVTIIQREASASNIDIAQYQEHEITVPEIPLDELPDIYYIILDSYPRADTLRGIFDFDNSEFLGSLEDNGFFIASESRSNYVATFLSLASSLNMRQLDELAITLDRTSPDQSFLTPFIEDNRLVLLSQSMGYKFAFLPSYTFHTRSNRNADLRLAPQVFPLSAVGKVILNPVLGNDYGNSLLRSTLLRGFVDRWLGTSSASLFTNKIEQLKTIPDIDGPVLTFAHFKPPHPAYIFDREGNTINVNYDLVDSWLEKANYINQLIWVNKSIKSSVEEILRKAGDNSVIVIQSDHGSSATEKKQTLYFGGEPDQALIDERTGIINAIYLPESCDSSGLYKSMTPVNTFRIVFNGCLGTDFEILEDTTFWSTYDQPYQLTPIKELLP